MVVWVDFFQITSFFFFPTPPLTAWGDAIVADDSPKHPEDLDKSEKNSCPGETEIWMNKGGETTNVFPGELVLILSHAARG